MRWIVIHSAYDVDEALGTVFPTKSAARKEIKRLLDEDVGYPFEYSLLPLKKDILEPYEGSAFRRRKVD
jgi:hypothetical protein